MLPNDHQDLNCRLDQLVHAIKMVFASTYFKGPKTFSKRTSGTGRKENMAVIVQKLVGSPHKGFFYPGHSRHGAIV